MPSDEALAGLGARRAALAMLGAVLRTDATLDSAAARHARSLAPADAALAEAIAGETLRRLPDLDALIDSATARPLPLDSKARMVLRLALAQKIALETPDHALVATALPLVEGGPRRLVHGVLGTLLRRNSWPSGPPALAEAVERRWSAAWGDEVVRAARRAILARAPLDLSFADSDTAGRFAAETGGTSLAQRHVRLPGAARVQELPGFAAGQWWVQDLAASLPARLMPQAPGEIADLCAAPGGKTMQLAAAGHQVVALDRSKQRLSRLRENLERTGLEAELVVGDALDWSPGRRFDAVLLDAPCSATGTFRRHPEVLYRARPRTIAEMAERQALLIERAAGLVRRGGTLVYSVCSLEPEEGEEVVMSFLARNRSFALAPPSPSELPEALGGAREGWLRLLPGMLEREGGLDGFFVARLVGTSD